MSDIKQDVTADPHAPLSETATLLSELKGLLDAAEGGEIGMIPVHAADVLAKAIAYIKNGEPFHPEPHPESGQGKWMETARMMARGNDFYRGIVTQVGVTLGKDAYTSDDGSVQDSVLALKVPELVKELKSRADRWPDPGCE